MKDQLRRAKTELLRIKNDKANQQKATLEIKRQMQLQADKSEKTNNTQSLKN